MDYPISVPGVGLVNGKFVNENQATGQVGSLIPAEWSNAITDEILNAIRAADLEPAEDKTGQLSEAIAKVVANAATEATQEQAEAGEDGTRKMTPRRVFEALRSAAANASETLRGVLRIGTQAEVDAGELDDVAVTPKKMRAGFSASFGTSGFIAFPTWMGGLIIQWLRGRASPTGVSNPLPVSYTEDQYVALAVHLGVDPAVGGVFSIGAMSVSTVSVRRATTSSTGSQAALIISIGK